MVQFILKRKQKLASGAEVEDLHHIDNSVFELEKCLKSGGFSEDQYDYHELVGVEIVEDKSMDLKKLINILKDCHDNLYYFCDDDKNKTISWYPNARKELRRTIDFMERQKCYCLASEVRERKP